MNTYGKDVTPIPIEVDKEKVVKEIQQKQFSEIYKRAEAQWETDSQRLNKIHC